MLFVRASLGLVLSSTLVALPAYASRVQHRTSSTSSSHAHLSSSHAHLAKSSLSRKGHVAIKHGHIVRGQQGIQPERVTQIQQALIREPSRSSEPTGNWDATTQAAMQKYQADQGWQTKLMPDSRALKKL